MEKGPGEAAHQDGQETLGGTGIPQGKEGVVSSAGRDTYELVHGHGDMT